MFSRLIYVVVDIEIIFFFKAKRLNNIPLYIIFMQCLSIHLLISVVLGWLLNLSEL